MSEIDDAAAFAPPPGVVWVVWPGWDFMAGESVDDQVRDQSGWPATVALVDTRAGKLAERFQTKVWIDDDFAATLYFEVQNSDSVQLAGILSHDEIDLEEGIARLTDIRPWDWWRTVSVRYALMRSFSQSAAVEFGLTGLPTAEKLDQLRAAYERTSQVRDLDQASQIAALPRRGRITPDLLREVARVYREAFSAGQAPTEAVAAHFNKPRSTAGRWVSQARRIGALGQADGPRAGEVNG